MTEEMLEFYCIECHKSVRAFIQASVMKVYDVQRQVVVDIDAVCEECGHTIMSKQVVETFS